MIERLECTRPEDVERRDVNDLAPDPRWIDGNVALLGDACHAVQPNLGQGGGQVGPFFVFAILSADDNSMSHLSATDSVDVIFSNINSVSSRRWFSPWSSPRYAPALTATSPFLVCLFI